MHIILVKFSYHSTGVDPVPFFLMQRAFDTNHCWWSYFSDTPTKQNKTNSEACCKGLQGTALCCSQTPYPTNKQQQKHMAIQCMGWVGPWCGDWASCWWELTTAAEALLAQTHQHPLAHTAVGGLGEVLHPPRMLAVLLRNLSQSQTTCGQIRPLYRAHLAGCQFQGLWLAVEKSWRKQLSPGNAELRPLDFISVQFPGYPRAEPMSGLVSKLAFSPSSTRRGTLFSPPRIHSCCVTVPLLSASMAVIVSSRS